MNIENLKFLTLSNLPSFRIYDLPTTKYKPCVAEILSIRSKWPRKSETNLNSVNAWFYFCTSLRLNSRHPYFPFFYRESSSKMLLCPTKLVLLLRLCACVCSDRNPDRSSFKTNGFISFQFASYIFINMHELREISMKLQRICWR